MSALKVSFSILRSNVLRKASKPLSAMTAVRKFNDDQTSPRVPLEKSINHVTLLGRVGTNPQARGSEAKPVVIFTLATNTNYKYDSGEFQQKTDWHRITVFKPHLRDTVMEYLRKGTRVYVEGRILYGEFSDTSGVIHYTTTIVANDVIFISGSKKSEIEDVEEKDESSI
ncbi:single-stranded DNA-binding protein, mitochondrial isoform X1 [Parasteatoda tepidariorum]|uniref:single-stranded DNA-binding protein, mitochondrial isoform X1 n=1 Tax=Parasteatoda tepidariorum TaxID=114398 RepID=UPI001C71DE59|nr:single-stranded DNA-binding protein, mitochondrial isoform X1 [Parasteatoda tepidariorum]